MADSPVGRREKPLKDAIPLWKSLGLAEERGKPVINADNMLRVLENDPHLEGILWYDSFHDRIFTTIGADASTNCQMREYTDTENIHLLTYFQGHLGIGKANDTILRQAVVAQAYRHSRNELRDWLDTLVHDGSPRIDDFMSSALGARKSIYTRAVSKNFWLSMVARVYRPGCQVDNMVVLEGMQGIGKNKALRAIGGKFYAQAPGTPDDKDFYLAFQGKLLIEFAELANLKKADAERIKSCITCTNDRYRSPYDRTSKDHPRQCIFVGTTNESRWLTDPSGARRFWPIKCEEENLLNVKYIEDHHDQLFAEAVSRFKQNETWWEVPESAPEEQEARRIPDAWEDAVAEYSKGHPQEITVAEVADYLQIPLERLNMAEQKRIASCLRLAGRQDKHTNQGNRWVLPVNRSEPSVNGEGSHVSA